MTRKMMAQALSDYFSKNGGSMDLAMYKSKGNDVPVKDYVLRKHFGNWSMVLAKVERIAPWTIEVVKPVKKAPAKKSPAKKKVETKDVE
jgi:predicted membrane-bound spermidine synthase